MGERADGRTDERTGCWKEHRCSSLGLSGSSTEAVRVHLGNARTYRAFISSRGTRNTRTRRERRDERAL